MIGEFLFVIGLALVACVAVRLCDKKWRKDNEA